MSVRRGCGLVAVFILIAVVAASGPGAEPAGAGGGCRGTASTEGAGTAVVMREICFKPTVLHVEAGQAVTWTNEDSAAHSVAGATVEWGNYTTYGQGGSVSFRFEKPGTYPYYCFEHNGMTGAIVVGDGRGTEAGNTVKAVSVAVATAAPVAAPAPAIVAAKGDEGGPGWPGVGLAGALGLMAGGATTLAWINRKGAKVAQSPQRS